MQVFEETMAFGQTQYQDVIDELTTSGLPTAFTLIGGMNVGLEARLEGGHTLLVSDAAGSLPWSRADLEGWKVVFFTANQDFTRQVVAADATDDGSVAGLLALIARILHAADRGLKSDSADGLG